MKKAGGTAAEVDVLIIGAGFAGLSMAVRLRRAGFSCLMVERAEEVGGTWRANTYPGCACDIPSHLYSFSFALNPHWSRMYAQQAEIWDYMRQCVEDFNLRPFIRFRTELREAIFDEDAHVWRVHLNGGEEIRARAVVPAMGALSRPAMPRIPGLERFAGPAFHTAEWDHSFALKGKRVAVIGTGASAIQVVPQIAPLVDQLHVFQRNPSWILPKLDRPMRGWEISLFEKLPGAMRAFRSFLYWQQEMLGLGYAVKPAFMKVFDGWARRYLQRSVPDPVLREKLTPKYHIGCKRVLLSNDYLPALCRPNVELVADGIAEIREKGILTVDGIERPVDAIVYATGFRTSELLSPVRFVGAGGLVLNDVWRDSAEALMGASVAGFPNLFFLAGPNSRVANNSNVFMMEAQAHHIVKSLEFMRRRGFTAMEAKPQAQAEFNRGIHEKMRGTVFATGCRSWYQDAQGRNIAIWPSFTCAFWLKTRRLRQQDYAFSVAPVHEKEASSSSVPAHEEFEMVQQNR